MDKSELKIIFKQGAFSTIIDIVIKLLSSVTGIFVARLLGPLGTGDYSLLLALTGLISLISILGVNFAHVYFLGNKRYSLEIIEGNIIFFVLIGFIIAILTLFILSNFFVRLSFNNVYYFVITVFVILLSIISLHFGSILLGLEKIKDLKLVSLVSPMCMFFSFFIPFLLRKSISNSLLYILVVFFVSHFLTIIFYFSFMLSNKMLFFTFHFVKIDIIKDSLNYGIKNWIGNILYGLTNRLDFFLVAYFTSVTQVGYYSVAVSLSDLIGFIPRSFSSILLPKFSRLDNVNSEKIAGIIIRHMSFFVILLGFFFVIFGKQFINILYSEEFLPAYIPFLILILGATFMSINGVLFNFFAANGKPQIPSIILFIGLIVNTLLDLILIPKYSIIGASFASTMAYILTTIIAIIVFVKRTSMNLCDIIILKKTDFIRMVSIAKSLYTLRGK